MPFLVKSRRASVEKLLAQHRGASVVDVTSRGPEPWVRFSPFFPHGGIPVPFSPGATAMSVEGIWQGLKVFEGADVDPATLQIATMKGIKRTVRAFGKVLGHRAGLAGDRLLPYAEARRVIYLPTYRWVLEHKLVAEVAALRELAPLARGPRRPVPRRRVSSRRAGARCRAALGPIWERSRKRVYFLQRWPSQRSMKRVRQRVKEMTGRSSNGVKDVRVLIRDLNPVLRGWGNYFRTGNAADKFNQVDDYVRWRLRRFLVKRKGRNLRPGEADGWTSDFFVRGHGLHRLRGTVRYPEAA